MYLFACPVTATPLLVVPADADFKSYDTVTGLSTCSEATASSNETIRRLLCEIQFLPNPQSSSCQRASSCATYKSRFPPNLVLIMLYMCVHSCWATYSRLSQDDSESGNYPPCFGRTPEEAAAKFVARIAVAFAVAVIIASMKET